jgi:tetratricopeptide (TPR) repeat protein
VTLAINNFGKAVRLGSRMPGLYYNYGLLLQQQGKVKESEKILLKGFSIEPQATNINYALAFLYMQQNTPEKARKHAQILKQMDPQNPDYRTLFQNLGL